jgi:hypothetical protein
MGNYDIPYLHDMVLSYFYIVGYGILFQMALVFILKWMVTVNFNRVD